MSASAAIRPNANWFGPELVDPATWRNYTTEYSSASMVITNETDGTYGLYQSVVDTIDSDPRFLVMEARLNNSIYYSVTVRAKGTAWLNYFKPGVGYVNVGVITSNWQLFNFSTNAYGNSILFETAAATIDIQLVSIKQVFA